MISTAMASALHIRYRPGYEPGNAAGNDPELRDFDPVNPGNLGTLLADQFRRRSAASAAQ